MSDHDCPGVSRCRPHPRWHVVYVAGMWFVCPPHQPYSYDSVHLTHTEAVTAATKAARTDLDN